LPLKKQLGIFVEPILNTSITKQRKPDINIFHLVTFNYVHGNVPIFSHHSTCVNITTSQNLLVLSLFHTHNCTQKQHYVWVTQIHLTSFLKTRCLVTQTFLNTNSKALRLLTRANLHWINVWLLGDVQWGTCLP
jgi:hypothetical protein